MIMLFFCIRNYLTIIPRAQVGSDAIAHETEAACKESRVRYSPGLVDFTVGLVIFVLNLPDGQVFVFFEIQITEGL